MQSVKNSMRNKRKSRTQHHREEQTESDDVEEVYSITESNSVEELGQDKTTEKLETEQNELNLVKKRVKYWIEIFLPRIDFKEFKDPSPKESAKQKFSMADDLHSEYEKTSTPDIRKENNHKRKGGSAIYHKYRVLPVVLLPFFVDTLIGHKKIQNSSTNLVFRLIEQLKKFRNSLVSGKEYSDYANSIPLYLNGINVNSFSGMNYESASLDATILQLETNFERLLFHIHSRSIEIQQLAQSLAYDTRDSISLLCKASNKLYSKTLSINSRINRLEQKRRDDAKLSKKKGDDQDGTEHSDMEKMWSVIKKLQTDIVVLQRENKELKSSIYQHADL